MKWNVHTYSYTWCHDATCNVFTVMMPRVMCSQWYYSVIIIYNIHIWTNAASNNIITTTNTEQVRTLPQRPRLRPAQRISLVYMYRSASDMYSTTETYIHARKTVRSVFNHKTAHCPTNCTADFVTRAVATWLVQGRLPKSSGNTWIRSHRHTWKYPMLCLSY